MRLLYVLASSCSFSTALDLAPAADAEPDVTIDAAIDAPIERVTRGLVALYTFEEGSGSTIIDRSGVAPGLDLAIPVDAPVAWGSGTLAITGETLIASPTPAKKILDACRTADAVTIEAWITPSMIGGFFPRVVTLSENNGSLAVTLMAIDSHFELRMRGPMTDANGLPSLDSPANTVTLAPIHVVLVSDPAGPRQIYVGGVERASDALGGDLASWGTEHRLAIGNEIDMGGRHWLGTFDRVAIYAAAFTADEVATNFAAGP